jgi:hypothetical protein
LDLPSVNNIPDVNCTIVADTTIEGRWKRSQQEDLQKST